MRSFPLCNYIEPIVRAGRDWLRYRRAWCRARFVERWPVETASVPNTSFIIGCGRSGTSLLGDLLARHESVRYLFEPYHIWAAIDPSADMINLYTRHQPKCVMDRAEWSIEAQNIFDRLIALSGGGKDIVIEKTPINALRIGFLDSLAPRSRFVHIVRNGHDVARSIERLSQRPTYAVFSRRAMNCWWGVGSSKWQALVRDGIAAGYFADEACTLRNFVSRGAYEWLVTMLELDRWRQYLGERLLELRYDELTDDPKHALQRIAHHLELTPDHRWLEQAVKMVHPAQADVSSPIVLPPSMCAAFNSYQQRYGFTNLASADDCASPVAQNRHGGNIKMLARVPGVRQSPVKFQTA